MATTGTIAWNPDVSDIVEEAYEQAGHELRTGYDLLTARRSLNFLLLEWQNKGINLWTITEEFVSQDSAGVSLTTNFLNKSTASYRVALGTISLFDVMLRENDTTVATQQDYTLTRISQPQYSHIPNKLTLGRPLQYYYQRTEVQDTGASSDTYSLLTLWPVPDAGSKYKLKYFRMRRLDEVGNVATNTMQIPDRFMPALVSGLAYKIAVKKATGPDDMARVGMLKAESEGLFLSAAEEDRDKTSARFVPDMSVYRV